jgi:hypothetical protein
MALEDAHAVSTPAGIDGTRIFPNSHSRHHFHDLARDEAAPLDEEIWQRPRG